LSRPRVFAASFYLAVAGGVVEAAICYTGDVFTGEQGKRGADYKYK
jgi:pyruvate carboxylase